MKQNATNYSLLIALCFLLASCFSPWTGDGEGTFTITVGVAPRRATLPWDNTVNISELVHTIGIFNSWPEDEEDGEYEPVFFQEGITSGSRIGFSLPPGNYLFTVQAFHNNEPVAFGYIIRNIRAGNNGLIQIEMFPAGDSDSGYDSDSADDSLTTIEEVEAYIAASTANPVRLNVAFDLGIMTSNTSNWQRLLGVIAAGGKNVALNLSQSTMSAGTVFNPVHNVPTGKDRIVSLVLPNAA